MVIRNPYHGLMDEPIEISGQPLIRLAGRARMRAGSQARVGPSKGQAATAYLSVVKVDEVIR